MLNFSKTPGGGFVKIFSLWWCLLLNKFQDNFCLFQLNKLWWKFSIYLVYPEYKIISGSRAELPCNVTLPSEKDAITLVLWYRGNTSRTPIYSLDARVVKLENATHFKGDAFTANRVCFDMSVRPALLKIDPVLEEDGMEYRCRVDFRWGRTMNTHVFLKVIGRSLGLLSFIVFLQNHSSITYSNWDIIIRTFT